MFDQTKVCLEIPFSKNLYHIEISHLISNANQLIGFYMKQVFAEMCYIHINIIVHVVILVNWFFHLL